MNFNVPPYFDDYNEAKDFLKVLFRPEYGVQARELNQVQSILQKQVERVGRYLFEEGSTVVGGQTNVDLEFAYVRLSGLSLPVGVSIADIKQAIASGRRVIVTDNPADASVGSLVARVIRIEEAAGSDPLTAYVRYENSGNNGIKKVFAKGETLSVMVFNGAMEDTAFSGSVFTVENNPSVDATGFGSAVSINEGTRFLNGFFIGVRPETIILDKYSNTPSYRVGLSATEEIVTPETDPSLFDNAIGSPNENAPGAHRFRIVFALKKLPFDPNATSESSDNFIPLISLNGGEQQLLFADTKLASNGIQKQLAERTFDQNGNFVVQPFNINTREHLKDGENDGKFSAADGGDESKFAVEIESGRAYVNGFLINQTATATVVGDKPRTSLEEQNILVTGRYGNWIDVALEGATGFVPPYEEIQLFDVPVQQLDINSLPAAIGSARVVNMLAAGDKPRLYLSNIVMESGYEFRSARSYVAVNSPTVTGAAQARGNLVESTFNGSIEVIETETTLPGGSFVRDDSGDAILSLPAGSLNSSTDYLSKVTLEWDTVDTFDAPNDISATVGDFIPPVMSVDGDNVVRLIGESFMVNGHTNGGVQTWNYRVKEYGGGYATSSGTQYRRKRGSADSFYTLDATEIITSATTTGITNQKLVTFAANLVNGGNIGGIPVTKVVPAAGAILPLYLSSNANRGSSNGITIDGVAGWKLKAIGVLYPTVGYMWYKSTDAVIVGNDGRSTINNGSFYIVGDTEYNSINVSGTWHTHSNGSNVIAVYENANYTKIDLTKDFDDVWVVGSDSILAGKHDIVSVNVGTVMNIPSSNIRVPANNIIEIVNQPTLVPSSGSITATNVPVAALKYVPKFSSVKLTKRSKILETVTDISGLNLGDKIYGSGFSSAGAVVVGKTVGSPNQIVVDEVPSTAVAFDAIATVTDNGGLKETNVGKHIAQIPFSFVNSASDFTYSVNRNTIFVADGNDFEVSVGAGEGFENNGTAYILNMNVKGDPDVPQAGDRAKSISIGTVAGSQLTIAASNFTAGQTYTVVYPVEKRSNVQPKSKALKTTVFNVTLDSLGRHTFVGINDVVSFNFIKESSVDVSSQYVKNTGIGDGYYEDASIDGGVAKAGVSVEVSITYYEHSATASTKDFFIATSYGTGGTEEYNSIPTYDGVNLRDAIDFRGGATLAGEPLVPNYSIRADIGYYIGRKDKLVVDKDGNYELISGQPSVKPEIPSDKDGAMTLAILDLPPYVIDANDIDVEILEHKRFTFRDIADINKRLNRLEYYTTLNVLERLTAERPVFDGEDETVKQGFIVDNFSTQYIGDVESDEYRCSIDLVKGELRPSFETNAVDLNVLNLQATDTGISSPVALEQNGELITLPIVEKFNLGISQPLGSRPVKANPFGMFNFEGVMKVSPDNDFWVNDKLRPRFHRYFKQFHAVHYGSNNWNSVWNSWQDLWRGRPESQLVQFNNGISTSSANTQQKSFGDGTISDVVTAFHKNHRHVVGIYPYMRERTTEITCERMRRNTRLWAFFDGVNVSDHVYAATYDTDGNFTGYNTQPISQTTSALVTDKKGKFRAKFVIPNTPTLRFLSGIRTLRFIDNQNNSLNSATTVSEAIYASEGVHINYWWWNGVYGVRRALQRRFLINQARLARSTYASESTNNFRDAWADPVAQTFTMDKFSGGGFVTGVGLYFGSKPEDLDSATPITVQLRTVKDGVPSQDILPFATATIDPEDIVTDEEGLLETRFEFETPVYLAQDAEYALVVLVDNEEYFLWSARIGDFDLKTNQRITKQPYVGRMFKSTDAAIWKEEATEDLKFNIYTAKFAPSAGTVSFINSPLGVKNLRPNPLTTPINGESGTRTIEVLLPNHGMRKGSFVTLAGVNGLSGSVFGVPVGLFNTSHYVESVTENTFRIKITDGAIVGTSVGGAVGGGSGITSTYEVRANVFQMVVEEMSLPSTSTSWKVKIAERDPVTNQLSVPTRAIGFNPDDNTTFIDKERVIASDATEANVLGGAESFTVFCTMSSTNENLSPVIDTKRLGIIAVSNNVSAYDTNVPAQSSYVTKKVTLNEGATSMNVILEANLPEGADIKVYGRFQTSVDQTFDSIAWTELSLTSQKKNSADPSVFNEMEFAGNSSIIPNAFTSFAIKIEMFASVSSRVPRVTSFRAIASNRP